jgi:hypothetical protein
MRIAFVCQHGPIEAKAVLLAASIRAHLEPQIELIAAHPRNAGDLSVETTQALKHLDAHIRPIRNPLHADYPIGHKLVALALTAGPGLGIFLDSDILAMRRPTVWPTALGMVPASRNHHDRRVWERAYGNFGLLPPKAKAPPILTGDATAPYFNAGMIAVPGPLVSRLATTWINTALKLDGDHAIPLGSKRPYLDQLSIPIAAARIGHQIEPLDPDWNFMAWAFRLTGREPPIFFHYQNWQRLREEPEAEAAIAAACATPSVRAALAHIF